MPGKDLMKKKYIAPQVQNVGAQKKGKGDWECTSYGNSPSVCYSGSSASYDCEPAGSAATCYCVSGTSGTDCCDGSSPS